MEQAMTDEVERLARMPVQQLRARSEVYGEDSSSGHKQHLVRRIAWRLQVLAQGDLTERAERCWLASTRGVRCCRSAARWRAVPDKCCICQPALWGRGGAGWWIASTGGVMKVLSGLSGFLWERDYGVRGRATPPRERIVASGLLEKRRGSRRRLRLASGYPRERSWKL